MCLVVQHNGMAKSNSCKPKFAGTATDRAWATFGARMRCSVSLGSIQLIPWAGIR